MKQPDFPTSDDDQTLMTARSQFNSRWREMQDRGASAIEYLGLAVVTAVIITALALVPWMPHVTTGLNNAICNVLAAFPGTTSCAEREPMAEEDYQPRCVLNRGSQSGSLDGSLLIFDGSDGATMIVEERSEGEWAVTLMDDSASGISFDLIKLQAGPLLDVGAGAGILSEHNVGDTWTFDSEDEAVAFAEEVSDYVDANSSFLELGGMFHDRPGEDMPPQVTREVFSTEAFISGQAQIGPNTGGRGRGGSDSDSGSGDSGGFTAEWLPGISGRGQISDEMIVEVDHGDDLDDPSDDTTSITFGTGSSAEGSADLIVWDDDFERGSSSSMTIEMNADEEITGLRFREGEVTTNTDYDDAEYESTNWTTEISVETDREREIVEAWLEEGTDTPSAEGIREQPSDDGSAQSEFEDLLYNSGVTYSETHAGTSDDGGWDVGAKLSGIGGGFGKSTSESNEQLMEAEYLAPPAEEGGSRAMEETPC